MKRTTATFKAQIFDGSQCNASFKENGFLNGFASKTETATTTDQSQIEKTQA